MGRDVGCSVLRNWARARALFEYKEMVQANFRIWYLVELGHRLTGLKLVSLNLGQKKLYQNLLREEDFADHRCTL